MLNVYCFVSLLQRLLQDPSGGASPPCLTLPAEWLLGPLRALRLDHPAARGSAFLSRGVQLVSDKAEFFLSSAVGAEVSTSTFFGCFLLSLYVMQIFSLTGAGRGPAAVVGRPWGLKVNVHTIRVSKLCEV